MQQVAVLMSRMIEDVHKVAQNQFAEEYDRQDTRIWETLSRFSRTKFSPVASLIYNTAEGENVVGEKTTFTKELSRMWAPNGLLSEEQLLQMVLHGKIKHFGILIARHYLQCQFLIKFSYF